MVSRSQECHHCPKCPECLTLNKEFSIPNIKVQYAVIYMTAIKFHRLILIVHRRAVFRLHNVMALMAAGSLILRIGSAFKSTQMRKSMWHSK